MPWTFLGQGSFNKVYVSDDNKEVLKIRHLKPDPTLLFIDEPSRSVRLWNEINSNLSTKAYTTTEFSQDGWVCPYIAGEQASDNEISHALLDIFNHTGRIVLDAVSPKNFVKTPEREIVCIDIGLALQMEERDENFFDERRRKKSFSSLDAWGLLQETYDHTYFSRGKGHHPKTIETIKALLFIKLSRPDIFNVNFLRDNDKLLKQLAKAYDDIKAELFEDDTDIDIAIRELDSNSPSPQPILSKDSTSVLQANTRLQKEVPVNLEQVQQACRQLFMQYLKARGTIDSSGYFNPTLKTVFFRSEQLTKQKVDNMTTLLRKILESSSLHDIRDLLQHAETVPLFKKSNKLTAIVGQCKLIVEMAEKEGLDDRPRPLP